jgi:hypothetical protein
MWTLLGTGGALAVATGVSAVLLNRTPSELDELVRRSSGAGGAVWNGREGAALVNDGERYATLTAVLGVGALALLGAGTSRWLFEPHEDMSMSITASGSPRLLFQGSF